MRIIKINDFGTVHCGADEAKLQRCDILGNYRVCGECGDCPIVKLHEQLQEIQFDGIIDEINKKKDNEERREGE